MNMTVGIFEEFVICMQKPKNYSGMLKITTTKKMLKYYAQKNYKHARPISFLLRGFVRRSPNVIVMQIHV